MNPMPAGMSRVLMVASLAVGMAACATEARSVASASGTDSATLADEVLAAVRDHFLDAQRGAEWASRHAGYGAGLAPGEPFALGTRELLAELATSHTAYYTARDPEHAGLLAIFGEGLGLDVELVSHIGADVGHDGVVRAVFAGGPAELCGLVRGDRILSADGAAWQPVESLRGWTDGSAPVSLVVERAGGVTHTVTVVPRRELLTDVWRAALVDGVRVFEREDRRLGYVPVYSCAGQVPLDGVRDAIMGPLRDADALVLDLRGGWGGCSPEFVGLFDTAIPVLEFIARDGEHTLLDDRWRGPMVMLVDGGSRSGKELVAQAVKRNELGLLVGQRTAGAVVGGRVFPLSDGSLLYLAVVDALVDGVRLEGVGVAPDVVVADAPLGAGGWDPQLEEALDRADRMVRELRRIAEQERGPDLQRDRPREPRQ
jgi:carboxyl-terminal processing protease